MSKYKYHIEIRDETKGFLWWKETKTVFVIVRESIDTMHHYFHGYSTFVKKEDVVKFKTYQEAKLQMLKLGYE